MRENPHIRQATLNELITSVIVKGSDDFYELFESQEFLTFNGGSRKNRKSRKTKRNKGGRKRRRKTVNRF